MMSETPLDIVSGVFYLPPPHCEGNPGGERKDAAEFVDGSSGPARVAANFGHRRVVDGGTRGSVGCGSVVGDIYTKCRGDY
jgi:hypothetical protein